MRTQSIRLCGVSVHARSGISKSSTRRLLATLVERRLVRRSLADGRYRTSITMPVSTGVPVPAGLAFVVDVALPRVIALTKAISWPSDIHLLDGDRMRVLDSTRPLSPFHLYRGVVDHSVNIFGSASGMACLATLSGAGFEKIAAHTANDPRWGLGRFKLSIDEYRAHLEATRRRGYGTRIARVVRNQVFDDGLAAIAMPIYRGDRIFGAVSLLWPKAYLKPEAFASQHLDSLRRTTERIQRISRASTRTGRLAVLSQCDFSGERRLDNFGKRAGSGRPKRASGRLLRYLAKTNRRSESGSG